MNELADLIWALAVMFAALAGLLFIMGLKMPMGYALRVAAFLALLALFIPCVSQFLSNMPVSIVDNSGSVDAMSSIVVLVLLGHVVLTTALLRRRLRGSDGGRGDTTEIERTRGRERPRLPPRA